MFSMDTHMLRLAQVVKEYTEHIAMMDHDMRNNFTHTAHKYVANHKEDEKVYPDGYRVLTAAVADWDNAVRAQQ